MSVNGTKKLDWHFGLKMAYIGFGFIIWLVLNVGRKRRMKYSKEDEEHGSHGSHGTHGNHGHSYSTMADGLIYNKLSLLNLITIIFSFLIINECNLNQANDPMGVTIQLIQDSNKQCYRAICAGYYTLIALVGILFFMNVYLSMNAIQLGSSADVASIGGPSTTTAIPSPYGRPGTTTTVTSTSVLGDSDLRKFEESFKKLRPYDMGQFVRENSLNPMVASLMRLVSFGSIATYFIIVMLEYFSTTKLMNNCLYQGQDNHVEVRQWGIDSTKLCPTPIPSS